MWNPGSWTEELAPRVRLGSQHEIGEWWAKEFRIVFPGTLLEVSSLAFVKQGTPDGVRVSSIAVGSDQKLARKIYVCSCADN